MSMSCGATPGPMNSQNRRQSSARSSASAAPLCWNSRKYQLAARCAVPPAAQPPPAPAGVSNYRVFEIYILGLDYRAHARTTQRSPALPATRNFKLFWYYDQWGQLRCRTA